LALNPRRNTLVLRILACVALGMVGLSFAAVPLYSIFCRATGFGGATQRVEQAAKSTVDRTIEIRFATKTDRGLPWEFKPNQNSVTLKVGQTGMATFHAHNGSGEPIVGTAVYNVTPEKAALYFDKIQCFCFTQQMLKPQESADLPVAFFIDPDIVKDRNLDDVSVITLSYTFYKAQSQALQNAVNDEGRAAEAQEIDKVVSASANAAPAAKSPKDGARATDALAASRRVE
jgi:cytochrome c oxidase assembly protein subunit 11